MSGYRKQRSEQKNLMSQNYEAYGSRQKPIYGSLQSDDEDSRPFGRIDSTETDKNSYQRDMDDFAFSFNDTPFEKEAFGVAPTDKEHYSDESDMHFYHSADEFYGRQGNEKQIRTGRQRKKIAARTKGGEFQAKRKKRRVYVCCVSSEVDIQKLYEHILSTMLVGPQKLMWRAVLFGEALYIAKTGIDTVVNIPRRPSEQVDQIRINSTDNLQHSDVETGINSMTPMLSIPNTFKSLPLEIDESPDKILPKPEKERSGSVTGINDDNDLKISEHGSREIYIFEFGSVVLWGFPRGEEYKLLEVVKDFSKKVLDKTEFEVSEDDIAFVTSSDTDRVLMSNDVITLPELTTSKQRLAVSFAIAQSTVLAIYENRIDTKVAEYKYIPVQLAEKGKIKLSTKQIGRMIGDIFVIRHDLNLHSYILDVPDFFWEENKDDGDFAVYKMIMRYMEMDSRVEVLNKRLDMLRDLLDMLQQQMENAHASKLEWIVIWLIVVEVVIEVISLGGSIFGWWVIP